MLLDNRKATMLSQSARDLELLNCLVNLTF